MRHLIYFVFLSFLFACGNAGSNEQAVNSGEKVTAPDQGAQAQQNHTGTKYPSISMEAAQNLWNNCDYIDVIFYDLPISMSQDQKSDIQSMIQFISDSPAVIYPHCKPIGRIFFQKEANDLAVADFYLENGCNAFVFLENEKPTHGNLITESGLQYFKKILAKVPKF